MLYLRLEHDDGREEVVPLAAGRLRLGRNHDNDLVLDDYGVSRHHAELLVEDGRVRVRDLGSRNGTLVRGRTAAAVPDEGQDAGLCLRGGEDGDGRRGESEVAVGDEVRIGSVRLRLGESLAEAADAPAPTHTGPGALECETLDISGSRAVALLDFLARFAQLLSAPGTPVRAGEAVERLRSFARAARVELWRGEDARLALVASTSAQGAAGAGVDPRAETLVRAVLDAVPPRPAWREDAAARGLSFAAPAGAGTVLVLTYPAGGPRPAAEELLSLEVAAAIAGQLLGLEAARGALERSNRALSSEAAAWRHEAERAAAPAELVASSAAMRRLLEQTRLAARSSKPVLLTGPSGAGKEMVARFLHRTSPRRDGNFVAVNCAALGDELFLSEVFGHRRGAFTGALADRPGLLEIAAGGTLLLDEVGELTAAGQARLLRVLDEGRYRRLGEEQERSADVRIVAATNRDLEAAAGSGHFRRDLLFRLAVVELRVPALGERRDDILPLARLFLARAAAELGRGVPDLDVEASRLLLGWDWPGNVRELRNVMDRAAILNAGPIVSAADLRFAPPGAAPHGDDELGRLLALPREQALEGFRRIYFERLLEAAEWNVSRAARAAAMPRRNLQQAMTRLGLRRPAGPAEESEEGAEQSESKG